MARTPAETTGGDEPAFRPSGGLCPRPQDLRHLGAGLPGGSDEAHPPMRSCIPAAAEWAAGATCSPMLRPPSAGPARATWARAYLHIGNAQSRSVPRQ